MAEEEKKDLNNKPAAAPLAQPPEADDSVQLKECQAKCDEYLNGWKRAQADFINYKKEEAKRFSEIINFSNEALIKELLPVLDSFTLALAAVKGNEAAEKGFLVIKNQLENILKQQGVEKINVKLGDNFDPARHEAMAEEEVKDKAELSGKIVEELAVGYTLNGKVIRATKVKIGK